MTTKAETTKREVMSLDVKEYFLKWCKETKRSGGILVGSSIQEFLTHLQSKLNECS